MVSKYSSKGRFLVVSMKVQKVIESGWAPFETISKGGYIEGEP